MKVLLLIIDLVYFCGYVLLLRSLLKLTNTQITKFSSKYLLLVACFSIYWLLGSELVIGFTIITFLPGLRLIFLLSVGLLGMVAGIIILEDCIKREKKVLKKLRDKKRFMKKLKPFVTSKGNGFYSIKTAYYRFGMTLLLFGMFYAAVPGIFIGECFPVPIWNYFIIYALLILSIMVLIYRLSWIRIFRWAVNEGIIAKDEVSDKNYYIFKIRGEKQ